MKITFVGLGIMGSRMAANLLDSGTKLTVFNRSKKKSTELNKKGAIVADSVDEALKEADIIFTMLANPKAVEDLMFDNLASMKEGALWVDCLTVNPSFSIESQKRANEAKIHYLEAPVAGTKPQAANAELTFFVGGSKDNLEVVRPLLEQMGSKILHFGDIGKGASFKMVVNTMLGLGMLAFAEAVRLGECLGLEKEMLLNIIPNLPVSPPFTKMKSEMMKNGEFDTQFPLELLYKDLHLATISAYDKNQSIPLSNVAKEVYGLAAMKGFGRQDMAAIYEFLNY